MRPLRSSRPRLRAALVAMLAALAVTAVVAPGAAHAEVSGLVAVKMTAGCSHPGPVIFTKIKCGGTVRNFSPTGGAPTGELQLFNEGMLSGSFPTGSSRCTLQPSALNPQASTCSVVYEPRRLGLQFLDLDYLGDGTFDPATVENIALISTDGEPTATALSCQKVNFGQTGRCIATTKHTGPFPQPPTGVVAFSSIPSAAPVEFSSPSCQLQPLTSTASRCEVRYWPTKPGTWIFRARYEGTAALLSPSTGETTVTVQPPVNAP